MNRIFTLIIILPLLIFSQISAQEDFTRTFEIKEPSGLEIVYGGIIGGVDFDSDGLPDLYVVNGQTDVDEYDLIPRIYKFEWNPDAETWDSVWGAIPPVEMQNTWPAFAMGDLDKDGKPELYWGPVNNLGGTNLNPARILVYEYPDDGSDNMGVSDGFGGFDPNAQWTIVDQDNFNLRPIKFIIIDIDGDGDDELIFADRAGTYFYGVVSVDNIPDNGDGSEIWTLEASGLNDTVLANAGSIYDLAAIGNTIYLFAGSGLIYPVKYEDGEYTSLPPLTGVANEDGSFKGSVTADIDDDGTDEIILGGWASTSKVYVLKQVDDTLQTFEVADLSTLGAVTLNGAAVGDLDDDGNWDFVFGTRGSPASNPNNAVLRVEFQGGDISDPANYESSVIDSFLVPAPDSAGGQIDVITIANIDGDAADEVIYTMGYTRGVTNDTSAAIAILDIEFTPVSVELADNNIPDQYYLDQNFPNPFNPSTTIKFGITTQMAVELKVFDALGQEVMTLIGGQQMQAGSYNVTFDASGLASGTYIYRLKTGNNVLSKKMILLK